jgi:DNA polymerase I-like protein with 3'-5' exonuclease and polymerase domains
LAYIDWNHQEFGIAAVLSKDPNMIAAYDSGDPYLEFAKQVGAAPLHATKESHPEVRELFKACALGVNYGMGARSLASRIGGTPTEARELLRLHKDAYKTFWRWSHAALDHAMLYGRLWATFGWTVHINGHQRANPRSLRNFVVQGNGAEMLRIACCLATEQDVRVCAPVHDALLIESPLEDLNEAVALVKKAMSDASAAVLGGFRLSSDARVVHYPERYSDPRGVEMWRRVQDILSSLNDMPE